jgi:iron(III)-enterobactin esterase
MPNNAGNPTSIHSSMRYLVLRAAQKLPMRKIPLSLSLAFLAAMILTALPAIARASHVLRQTEHPTPPTRDPNNPGYVKAVELSDGANPPPSVDGNFILGPTHKAETPEQRAEIAGKVVEFTMEWYQSKIYPGIAREAHTFGTVDPTDPAKLVVTTNHPAPYSRTVAVYVPPQYVPGTAAPFIVGADGPDRLLFSILNSLIVQHKLPAMIAISIANGGGDAQGSERGLEYDTMSGTYAEFVETEVLPQVEAQAHVTLTKDPNARATMGYSSGGACALTMAWYHPDLYHRVLAYSGTFVNQQWPYNPRTPHGAWEYHEHLIPLSPVKPLRIWMEVGDRDLLNPNVMRDNMHDWVVANENMARVLAAKGYDYQFVFARNAGHVDRAVVNQTLPEALEYIWQDYRASPAKR